MSKYIIGIDPDSDKHGVAIYEDEKLVSLHSMQLIDFYILLSSLDCLHAPEVHIEDVCANNAAFKKRGVRNPKAGTAINRSVGKCQQSQIEIERVCGHLGVTVVKHKISKQWKDAEHGKGLFEKVTGWKGRSNEDTRSAAYFGYLGVDG